MNNFDQLATMTLTAYGADYYTFTFTDLKHSLRARGIEAPARDRRQMIRALRDADRHATYRFLDLPPELRNVIYADVLTASGAPQRSTTEHTYPCILATCKQVHDEANGLLKDVTHADIWLYATHRRLHALQCSSDAHHSLDMCSTGAPIGGLAPGFRIEDIARMFSWPHFLQNVRTINLKVEFQAVHSQATESTQIRECCAINLALYTLYELLSKQSKATTLQVEVSLRNRESDRGSDQVSDQVCDELLRGFLSPLCGIAGRFSTPTFNSNNISDNLITEIKNATVDMRALFQLEAETKLAISIISELRGSLAGGLGSYEKLLKSKHTGVIFRFDDSASLRGKIDMIEDEMERLANQNTADLSDSLAIAVARLKEMRELRKAQNAENMVNEES